MTIPVIRDIDLPGLPLFKTGKVRNVYESGPDRLLMVTSDRISAFDYILPNGIPQKGQVLTEITQFWCEYLKETVPNHLISTRFEDFPAEVHPFREMIEGRSMLVKKTQLIEVECVVRGYLAGSGWKEYQQSGTVCGIPLPAGLGLADPLPEPLFTPAYKAPQGEHDENITLAQMETLVGKELARKLSQISITLYKKGREYAQKRGIILADTKFEFGLIGDEILLIDEVMTPDSSRFWDAKTYRPGISPPSFDKQIVRDYLESCGWDKLPPAPVLPQAIVEKTSQKYLEIKARLQGRSAT